MADCGEEFFPNDRQTFPMRGKRSGFDVARGPQLVIERLGTDTEDARLARGLLGRAWSELTLLRLAYAYEQATRHRRPPASTPALPPSGR
jgi:hypothetical protein